MTPTPRETKPVLDAVNDAVWALSGLVRSIRTSARTTAKSAKREAATGIAQARAGARGKVARLEGDARLAKRDLVRRGRVLKSRIGQAWGLLVHGEAEKAPVARALPRRKAPRGDK